MLREPNRIQSHVIAAPFDHVSRFTSSISLTCPDLKSSKLLYLAFWATGCVIAASQGTDDVISGHAPLSPKDLTLLTGFGGQTFPHSVLAACVVK